MIEHLFYQFDIELVLNILKQNETQYNKIILCKVIMRYKLEIFISFL